MAACISSPRMPTVNERSECEPARAKPVINERSECEPDRAKPLTNERSECEPDRAKPLTNERSECEPDRAKPLTNERSECEPDRAKLSRQEMCMRLSGYSRIIAAAAALCLLPAAVLAQEFSQIKRASNAPPKPSGTTPRTPDGHPDLTGGWNGLGDNLLGVPNHIANNGLAIESG